MSSDHLLTIGIPTYNRSAYLNTCLGQICKQLHGFESLVELIISDNHSPDDTTRVVESYIQQGFRIRYTRNESNLGPDLNFLQCFKQATGKYLLLLGDDDVLLDDTLKKVIEVLNQGEYGVVYLKSYGFSKNFDLERPKRKIKAGRTVIYNDVEKFVNDVSYWFTFTSGNIFNKDLIQDGVDIERFLGTQLNQLSWTFPALLRSKQNVVMNEYLIAAYNNSSFDAFISVKVFATNLNKIMPFFIKEGLSQEMIFNLNRNLLSTFFPFSLIRPQFKKETFDRERCLREFYPVYKGYFLFWLYIMPLLKLPLPFAKVWLFLIRVVNKLKSFI